jgi:hypothetical protein
MEIKDITVSVDLEAVRGGQNISVKNLGAQVGGNTALSSASSWGLGNVTSSETTQIAPQVFSQSTSIDALELHSRETVIANSMVGFPYLMK